MKRKNIFFILMGLISVLANKANAQICFMPFDTITIAGNPNSVISADFNRDGKADLATANVYILLGDGTGGFGTPVHYSVDSGPRQLISADFNGDGKIDIATLNYTNKDISVLLGDGTGGFNPAINYSLGTGFAIDGFCSADFNKDGKADLAVTNSTFIVVLFGDGAGSFSSTTHYSIGPSGANSIISADFNGDSNADFATAGGGTYQVSVFTGNGSGSFSGPAYYTASNTLLGIITDDFNGDSKADLASLLFNSVAVYVNNGTGGFGSAIYSNTGALSSQSIALCSADFDKDGKTDIATNNYMDNTISVMAGLGTGSFVPQVIDSIITEPVTIATADFNGDGLPDLVTGSIGSSDLTILLNCSTVGINEVPDIKELISLYPNPANKILNINFHQNQSENAEIKITDVLGNEVISFLTFSTENKTTSINISSLQEGIYFATIKMANGISTKKIIVQR